MTHDTRLRKCDCAECNDGFCGVESSSDQCYACRHGNHRKRYARSVTPRATEVEPVTEAGRRLVEDGRCEECRDA